jgi:hypothetical protein
MTLLDNVALSGLLHLNGTSLAANPSAIDNTKKDSCRATMHSVPQKELI